MDTDIKQKIEEQDKKLDLIYTSVEKTHKYFLIILWVTIIAFVVPAIGLLIAIPRFINSYLGVLKWSYLDKKTL